MLSDETHAPLLSTKTSPLSTTNRLIFVLSVLFFVCGAVLLVLGIVFLHQSATNHSSPHHSIPSLLVRFVDQETKRPVPLVSARLVNHIEYISDNNGIIFILEPGLAGRNVFLTITTPGYHFPKDGFGYPGTKVHYPANSNQTQGYVTLEVIRDQPSERLYRFTGAGLYRDTMLARHAAPHLEKDPACSVPVAHPLLNAGVLGLDSIQHAVLPSRHAPRHLWVWGDTLRAEYVLGNFFATAAHITTMDVDRGLNVSYIEDPSTHFVKPMAKFDPISKPTWISALHTLRTPTETVILSLYDKPKHDMSLLQKGVAKWNLTTYQFDRMAMFDVEHPMIPGLEGNNHALQLNEEQPTLSNGTYVYIHNPFPLVRVRADPAHWCDLDSYEGFTCLQPGSTIVKHKNGTISASLERSAGGTLVWGWKARTPPLSSVNQAKLLRQGALRRHEAQHVLTDRGTGRDIALHSGTVHWNAYRGRWVIIANEAQSNNSVPEDEQSHLGNVFYTEAPSLQGPWSHARIVAKHRHYTFYNPIHHAHLDRLGGRVMYFSGTYAITFSKAPYKTPRYDYNSVLYRVDLSRLLA